MGKRCLCRTRQQSEWGGGDERAESLANQGATRGVVNGNHTLQQHVHHDAHSHSHTQRGRRRRESRTCCRRRHSSTKQEIAGMRGMMRVAVSREEACLWTQLPATSACSGCHSLLPDSRRQPVTVYIVALLLVARPSLLRLAHVSDLSVPGHDSDCRLSELGGISDPELSLSHVCLLQKTGNPSITNYNKRTVMLVIKPLIRLIMIDR